MSRPDWRLLIYLRNQENSKKSLSWLWHIIKKKKHIKYKNQTRNNKMRVLIGFLLLCLQGKKILERERNKTKVPFSQIGYRINDVITIWQLCYDSSDYQLTSWLFKWLIVNWQLPDDLIKTLFFFHLKAFNK